MPHPQALHARQAESRTMQLLTAFTVLIERVIDLALRAVPLAHPASWCAAAQTRCVQERVNERRVRS
jgi:hypothetical protein